MLKPVGPIIVSLVFLSTSTTVSAQTCQLDLYVNPETIPLVLKISNGTYYFPTPTGWDDRLLDYIYEETGIFACPGGYFNRPGFNPDGQRGWCKGGTGFQCDWLLTYFHTMNCTMVDMTRPALSESYDNPDIACENSNRNVQVGYDIDGQLVSVYNVCFDGETLLSTYTKHRLNRFAPAAKNISRTPPNHFFFLVSLYQTDVQDVYDNYQTYFQELGVQNYINDTYFLTTGHLAPYQDFLSPFQQDATYHYANVAPQWNSFDQGNWRVLEDGLLQFIENATTYEGVYIVGDATVLTGTLQVASLTDSTGTSVDLYLREGQFPVPRWFWKIIYFESVNVGVVFFGYNNPFVASKEDVDAEFLADVCSVDVFESVRAAWYLDVVDNTDPALGYMYACRLHANEILDPLINSIVTNLLPTGVKAAEMF